MSKKKKAKVAAEPFKLEAVVGLRQHEALQHKYEVLATKHDAILEEHSRLKQEIVAWRMAIIAVARKGSVDNWLAWHAGPEWMKGDTTATNSTPSSI